MENYTLVPSDIHIWKQKYENDKVATINECMSEPPFCYNPMDRITHLVFIQPNEAFQKLSEQLPFFAEKFPPVTFFDTNIRFKFNKELRITRNIRIISDFGMLTISIKGNGIELENVAIYPEYQGKGKGSALMKIFFALLVETFGSNFPPIHLDCIGCASLGPNYITNSVSNQCKFFRKFGFRVTKYHKTGKAPKVIGGMLQSFSDHAEMEFNFDKWFNEYYLKINLVERKEVPTFV
jgi:GNAT superfamily N-acetyltransferase